MMQNVNAQFVIGPFLYFNVGSSSSSPSWSSQLIIRLCINLATLIFTTVWKKYLWAICLY